MAMTISNGQFVGLGLAIGDIPHATGDIFSIHQHHPNLSGIVGGSGNDFRMMRTYELHRWIAGIRKCRFDAPHRPIALDLKAMR